MAQALSGGAAFQSRRSDHAEEIARRTTQAGAATVAQEALVFAVATEFLQAHDETGVSLDDLLAPRLLVERFIGAPTIENEA